MGKNLLQLGLLKVFRTILFLIIVVLWNQITQASITTRTSKLSEHELAVAFDFVLNSGEHISAPFDKGKSQAPEIKFENADVIESHYLSKPIKQFDEDGTYSGFQYFENKLTILYKLKIRDETKPINYSAFYVVCGDFCMPKSSDGVLEIDGLVSKEDLAIFEKVDKPSGIDNFAIMLIFAFIGGIILNCMPCVFPVISIKIFSILKASGNNSYEFRKHSIMSVLGTMTVFAILSLIFGLIKQSKQDLSWGFYMQEPAFVYSLLLIFFASALHFLDVYQFHFPVFQGSRFKTNGKYISSYFGGAFSALTSTACVGPFAGLAIGSAILFGNFLETFAILISMGLGLSFPFLMISIFPGISRYFPKPGRWLEIFKEILGFIMLLVCIWLLWIISTQTSNIHAFLIAGILIVAAMFEKLLSYCSSMFKHIVGSIVVVAIISGYKLSVNQPSSNDSIWTEYKEHEFQDILKSEQPVFLNFTASWCLNCQYNKRVLNDPEVVEMFKASGIRCIECDWSSRSETISKLLRLYDSAAVPLYVYYPGSGKPYIKLPPILTKQILMDILKYD